MSYLFDTNIVIYYFNGLTADDALHQVLAREAQRLTYQVAQLPRERQAEVLDFVQFLLQ